ncbi:hypothetical protein C7999DRAFT_30066 [Corynascus novoguineensis]|uniref:Uncharacterized protein n=1 Tax=Corynascus novoguineensis TaxID=1126955 RepID=A0AAN7CW39_9PEZI|nr:hypothetical protein C7999DRAFT_30066 [Corynascus novoguineensis]
MQAQLDQREDRPATKILTVTKLHATLAAHLLLVSSNNDNNNNNDKVTTQPAPIISTNARAHLHLWCASLGFTWWYATQCSDGTVTRRAASQAG